MLVTINISSINSNIVWQYLRNALYRINVFNRNFIHPIPCQFEICFRINVNQSGKNPSLGTISICPSLKFSLKKSARPLEIHSDQV